MIQGSDHRPLDRLPAAIESNFKQKLNTVLAKQLETQQAHLIAKEKLGQTQTEEVSKEVSVTPVSMAKIEELSKSPEAALVKKQNEASLTILGVFLSFILIVLSYLNPVAYFGKKAEANEDAQTIKKISSAQSVQNEELKIDPQQLTKAATKLMTYLKEQYPLDKEGIFRIPGNISQTANLVKGLEASESYSIEEQDPSVDVIAGAIKELFGKMELFGESEFIGMGSKLIGKKDDEIVTELKEFVGKLPTHQKEALKQLMDILGEVSQKSDVNKMTSNNLAIVVAPRLFKLENPIILATAAKSYAFVAEALIDHRAEIFA